MNILLVDPLGLLLDFAMRAQVQGHSVRTWMLPQLKGSRNRIGEGLVQRMRSWGPSADRWADLVVASDNTRYMGLLESFRRRGVPVWAAGPEVASWELDRRRGQEVLQAAGVPIADSVGFTSYRRATEWVKNHPGRFVAKPNGDKDRALSYVAKGQEDLLYMLDLWARKGGSAPDFVLQEFIPGVEFAVGGFFGPGGWEGVWLENFEHKKLMAGDVGPNTGEMGTVMRYVGESKLADEMLVPLTGALYRAGYVGYLDVSVIVDERGRAWPLEFTSRFGYPLWLIQQALHPDTAGWMYAVAKGDAGKFKPRYQVACGVVMALQDFPYCRARPEEADGVPLFGAQVDAPWLHLDAARMDPELGLVSAGTQPLVVSGRADSIRAASEAAYTALKRLHIPASPLYRVDIGGPQLETRLRYLQARGYAKEWRYDIPRKG